MHGQNARIKLNRIRNVCVGSINDACCVQEACVRKARERASLLMWASSERVFVSGAPGLGQSCTCVCVCVLYFALSGANVRVVLYCSAFVVAMSRDAVCWSGDVGSFNGVLIVKHAKSFSACTRNICESFRNTDNESLSSAIVRRIRIWKCMSMTDIIYKT